MVSKNRAMLESPNRRRLVSFRHLLMWVRVRRGREQTWGCQAPPLIQPRGEGLAHDSSGGLLQQGGRGCPTPMDTGEGQEKEQYLVFTSPTHGGCSVFIHLTEAGRCSAFIQLTERGCLVFI